MGNLYHGNTKTSELYDLQKGLLIALRSNLVPLEINIDCKGIIQLLINDHLSYTNVLYDCREMLRKLGNTLIHHRFREENKMADALAKEGSKLKGANSFIFWSIPPFFVSAELEADKTETSFARGKRSSSSVGDHSTYYSNTPPLRTI